MIYLRTGLPGASKTLNSLRELVIAQDPERPMYYNNVKLLMLDMDVARSFAGWYYGWYFPRLKDQAQKRKLIKIMKPIHDNDEFLSLSDVPWLDSLYESHDHFETWLYWVRRVYPKRKLEKLELLLSACDDQTLDKFEMVQGCNLHFNHFADPKAWMDLPKRSIIFVDECQQFFPPRAVGSKVPAAIGALETHRHGGYDIHFVTQDRTLTDANLRKLVGKHIHFYNPFGGSRVTRKEAQKCFDPNDYHDSKQAIKKVVKRDSSFYGVYWSAEIHTHKFRFPPILLAGLLCIFLVVVGLFYVYSTINKNSPDVVQADDAPASAATKSASSSPAGKGRSINDTVSSYLDGLLDDVYISGSIMRVGSRQRSFEYVFYRATDDAAFDPSALGLIVQPIDKCMARLKLGEMVKPITCNPFYIRAAPEPERDDSDGLGGLAANASEHMPKMNLF